MIQHHPRRPKRCRRITAARDKFLPHAAVKQGDLHCPALRDAGKKPFVLDSPRPTISFKEYAYNEMRYRVLSRTHPIEAQKLLKSAQELVEMRWQTYEHMAKQEPARFQPRA